MRPTTLIVIAAAVAALYAFGWAERTGLDASAGIIRESDERARLRTAEYLAMHYQALAALKAGYIAKCLQGNSMIAWTDPHSGASMGTFCDTQVLSQAKTKP